MEFREEHWVNEDTVDSNNRYYIEGGLSFLPPSLYGLNSTVYNRTIRFGYHYRAQGVSGSVRVLMINADEKTLSFQDIEQREKKDIEKTNSFRAGITERTTEDHWQDHKRGKTISQLIDGHYKNNGEKLVSVRHGFPESEWENIAESFFKSSLTRQRARYNSIPQESYQYIKIKNFDCIQTEEYERLGMPVAQHAQRTGGGINHFRIYSCFIRPKQRFGISISMDIANGVELNYDDIIKRTLDSLELDESLPATDTTYSKMKAQE
jgi:hypothetical protein